MKISQSRGVTLPLSAKKQVSQSERNTDSGNLMQSNPMARPSANLLAARAGVHFTGCISSFLSSRRLRELSKISSEYQPDKGILKKAESVHEIVEKLDLNASVVVSNVRGCIYDIAAIIEKNHNNKSSYSVLGAKRNFLFGNSLPKKDMTPEEKFAYTYANVKNALQAQVKLKTAQKRLIDHFPQLKKENETLEAEIEDHEIDLAMEPKKLKEKYIQNDYLGILQAYGSKTSKDQGTEGLIKVVNAYNSGKLQLTNPNICKEFDSEFKTLINKVYEPYVGEIKSLNELIDNFKKRKTGEIPTKNKDMINVVEELINKNKELHKEFKLRKEFLSTLPRHLRSYETKNFKTVISGYISEFEKNIKELNRKKAFYQRRLGCGRGDKIAQVVVTTPAYNSMQRYKKKAMSRSEHTFKPAKDYKKRDLLPVIMEEISNKPSATQE